MGQNAVDLERTLRWDGATGADAAMLADLQCNILDGHGRKATRHVFLEFLDADAARDFLHRLEPHVTSAADQLQQAKAFREHGTPGPAIISVLLTHAGYQALGVAGKAPVANDDGAFSGGMASRAGILGDDPAAVENAFTQTIHAKVLIGADPDGQNEWGSLAAENAETKVLNLMGNSARIVTTEIGRAVFRDNGPMPGSTGRKIEGIEHFGYVDGRSQPLMLDELIDRERDESDGTSIWNPAFPLGQVLVPDPGAPEAEAGTAFGSFFVFRKLEQNVHGFKQAEETLGDIEGGKPGEKVKLGELAGAMLVGRFEDGTPVTMQREDGVDNPVPNNFDYASDMAGLRCPFHAHIRKTNPRGDTVRLLGGSLEEERSRIMARRGMPYGTRDQIVDPSDEPTGGVGLMFMSYQSNLRDQFEFTQASWANNPRFASGFAGLPDPGRDPIIGQRGTNDPVEIRVRDRWGNAAAEEHLLTFEEYVTFRGGEYFFAPAKSTLRMI